MITTPSMLAAGIGTPELRAINSDPLTRLSRLSRLIGNLCVLLLGQSTGSTGKLAIRMDWTSGLQQRKKLNLF